MRKPWFRKQTGFWYWTTPSGQQVNLGENRDDAFSLWHQLAVAPTELGSRSPLVEIADAFLLHVQQTSSPATHAWYLTHLARACAKIGAVAIGALKPVHVSTWLDQAGAPKGTRRACIRCLKAALNWAVDGGLVSSNPLGKMKAGRDGRREVVISEEEHNSVVGRVAPRVRTLLCLLWHTGMRPEEARRVTRANWRPLTGQLVFPRAKGGRPRVVRLTACMQTLVRILCWARPEGPLLLTERRREWNVNNLRCVFRRLRESGFVGAGVTAYTYRHTFVTDALERGLSTAAVAELVGHRDASMIAKHYSHLEQRGDMLTNAAATVRVKAPPSDRTSESAASAPPSGSSGGAASESPAAPEPSRAAARKTGGTLPRPKAESESRGGRRRGAG